MKHLAALTIISILSVGAPIQAFAVDTTPSPVSTNVGAPIQFLPTPNITLTSTGIPTYTSAGDTSAGNPNPTLANCGSANATGSLNNLSSSGISSLVQKLAPGQAGSLLGKVAAPQISGIINQLTGGGQTGQLINSLLSGNTSGITNMLGSGLQNILGGSGGGLSGITSALGGAGGLGGALGVVGGALGGGEVPVGDSKVRSATSQIQSDQDTYIKKVCYLDPAVRAASHQYTAQFSSNVIKASDPLYSKNIAQSNKTLADATHSYYLKTALPQSGIDQTLVAPTQQYLDNQYNSAGSLKCPVQNTQAFLKDYSKGGLDMFKAVMVDNPQCTPIGAALGAQDQENALITSRLSDQQQLTQQAQGILPTITCSDPNSANNTLENCVNYTITTPASVTNDTVKNAAKAGADQQARASQVGDLVTPLFAQIEQIALTSLQGLAGLAQQSSTGQGSILDQITGSTNTTAVAQAQNSLLVSIQNSLAIENEFQVLLADSLVDLGNTKNSYSAVQSCYQGLAGSGSGTISAADATQNMNAASSTILTTLNPQITSISAALTNSANLSNTLTALQTQAQSAQNIATLNSISSAYQSLASQGSGNGGLHTQDDLTALVSGHDTLQTLLTSMITDATTQGQQCVSYGGTLTITPNLTLSSPTQPANVQLSPGQALVPYTRFTLTASNSGDVVLNSVTVQRSGTGTNDNGIFTGIVLIDEASGAQIGGAQTLNLINAVNQATIGVPITIAKGTSKTFLVAANIAPVLTPFSGEAPALSLVAINTGATVGGTLPIIGTFNTVP